MGNCKCGIALEIKKEILIPYVVGLARCLASAQDDVTRRDFVVLVWGWGKAISGV
jgi:hypothetical protein